MISSVSWQCLHVGMGVFIPLVLVDAQCVLASGGDPASTTSLVFLVLLLNQVLLGLGITMVAFYARGILREVLGRPRYHIWEEV